MLTVSALLVRNGDQTVAVTPLQYQDMDVGEDEPFAALNNGLWLFAIEAQPIAVLFSQHVDRFTETRFAQLEIATLPEPASLRFTRAFLSAVQEAGRNSTLYRGKVLSFEAGSDYSGMRADARAPAASCPREAVILDAPTMARLDRHVFAFDRHREGLKRLGQSTRKGLLLYGPPGTGKTHASSATSPRT